MANVYRLTLAVLVLIAALISITRLMSTTQPAPLATLFTNANGTSCERPCLFGVQPGKTVYQHAVRQLRTHLLTRSFQPNLRGDIFRGTDQSVILYLDAQATVVGIELVSRSPSSLAAHWGSLGQVIALLGLPERIEQTSDRRRSYYLADHLVFSHRQIPGTVSANAVCEEIGIYAQRPDLR
jgi:hypothetical protein